MPRTHQKHLLKPPSNASKTTWYRMEATSEDEAEVFIYDAIGGWWGVEASQFVKDLSTITASKINLRVNSPGGDVYDALAIMNALKRHTATVAVTVDGLAASAASFIIQAADEISMGKGAEIMIHDALTLAIGNPTDFREAADFLDRISNTIASVYADRAGGTQEQWRERMTAETWYTAEEAVAAGLADSVIGSEATEKQAENLKSHMDLSAFAYAGRREAPAPPPPSNVTPQRRDIQDHLTEALAVAGKWRTDLAETDSPAQPITKEGADMSDSLLQGVIQRLGIKNEGQEITEQVALDALDEVLAEQVDNDAASAASPAVPEGAVVLDEAQYSQLKADAKAGRDARDQQQAEHRTSVVADAVRDGRIPPSRREYWLNLLAKDPGAEESLKALAPGLVPVEAKGYTGGVDESSDEDALYSNVYSKEA